MMTCIDRTLMIVLLVSALLCLVTAVLNLSRAWLSYRRIKREDAARGGWR